MVVVFTSGDSGGGRNFDSIVGVSGATFLVIVVVASGGGDGLTQKSAIIGFVRV